jgi:hypothetical protein
MSCESVTLGSKLQRRSLVAGVIPATAWGRRTLACRFDKALVHGIELAVLPRSLEAP